MSLAVTLDKNSASVRTRKAVRARPFATSMVALWASLLRAAFVKPGLWFAPLGTVGMAEYKNKFRGDLRLEMTTKKKMRINNHRRTDEGQEGLR